MAYTETPSEIWTQQLMVGEAMDSKYLSDGEENGQCGPVEVEYRVVQQQRGGEHQYHQHNCQQVPEQQAIPKYFSENFLQMFIV